MPRYPSLFQINARVWLNHLSRKAGKPITLADIVVPAILSLTVIRMLPVL
jgi:hypothetical protein